jgi:hypothetical protein
MPRGRIVSFVLALALAPVARATPALPFIENDFDKAMASAKAQQRPVFVEVWAPW